ncbi:unnamed protein product [Hanseniaspora opuntiae]|uniref:Protein ERP4 n=1 Tax=Hanseniaspora opuntiae TaxID=211096 RepID=A0A1E5RKB7_9ASCO|nr:Protein ERP4 [Hanseniaspora opuntiae]
MFNKFNFFIVAIFCYFTSTFTLANTASYSPVVISLPSFTKECMYYDLYNDDDALVVSYQVLTGGNFEIDFEITSPDGNSIISEKQKKYSDFVLKSFGAGQYAFCFSNSYGTSLKKIEITIEPDKSMESLNENTDEKPEDVVANHAIEEIDRNLSKITKLMNYLRAREWRNQSTVESTSSRVVWFSIVIMLLTFVISFLQTLYVQYFFKERSRGFV